MREIAHRKLGKYARCKYRYILLRTPRRGQFCVLLHAEWRCRYNHVCHIIRKGVSGLVPIIFFPRFLFIWCKVVSTAVVWSQMARFNLSGLSQPLHLHHSSSCSSVRPSVRISILFNVQRRCAKTEQLNTALFKQKFGRNVKTAGAAAAVFKGTRQTIDKFMYVCVCVCGFAESWSAKEMC